MYLFALMKDFYNNNLWFECKLILYGKEFTHPNFNDEYHIYKITISHPLVKLNSFGVVFDGGYDMAQ